MRYTAEIEEKFQELRKEKWAARDAGDKEREAYFLGALNALTWVRDKKDENSPIEY